MLRAEWRKLRSTRTTWALWLAAIAVVIVGDVSTVSSSEVDQLTGHLRDQPFHLVSSVNISLFAVLLGVRAITDEYRYDTMAWTLLTRRHRGRALSAKALVAAAHGLLLSLVAQAAGIALALWTIDRRGAALDLDLADGAAVGGLVLAGAAWAVLGVAVGTLVRNQVVTVALALAWILAIENLGSLVLGAGSRLLPGQAAHALAATGDVGLLSPLGGLAVVATYVLILGGVAAWSFDRRALPTSA